MKGGENPSNVLSKSDNNNIREDLWCISIGFKVKQIAYVFSLVLQLSKRL
mgnify:CR=1 FL=1